MRPKDGSSVGRVFVPDSQLLWALGELSLNRANSVARRAMKDAARAMKTRGAKLAGQTLNLSAPAIKTSMTWYTPWDKDPTYRIQSSQLRKPSTHKENQARLFFYIVGRPVPITADKSKFAFSYEAKWKGSNRPRKGVRGSTHQKKVVVKITKQAGFKTMKGYSQGNRVFIAKSPTGTGRSFTGGFRRVYERRGGSTRIPFKNFPPALSVMQLLERRKFVDDIVDHGMEVMKTRLVNDIISALKLGAKRAGKSGSWSAI